jgi:hypothetical protein
VGRTQLCEELLSGDTLSAIKLILSLLDGGVQVGTVFVIEQIPILDDGDLHFGSVGKVNTFVDDDPSVPHMCPQRQGHDMILALGRTQRGRLSVR